jgi:hypothetical protein
MTMQDYDERDRIELEVCVDCLAQDANGESEGADDGFLERFTRAMESARADGWEYSNNCPEDCEGGFSWAPCDFCGSRLGGDRHPAVLMRKVREAR